MNDTLRLTPRERAVLTLAAHGHAKEEVAHQMRVAPRTVARHLARTYAKLGAGNRVQAFRIAVRRGLMPHPFGA